MKHIKSILAVNSKKSWVQVMTFIFILIPFLGRGQTSFNNNTGDWNQGTSWIGGSGPSADNGLNFTADIYGYLTRNGNVVLANNARINVYDTLVIDGNLSLGGSGGIVMHDNALLVVLGDFFSNNTGSNLIDNDNFTTSRVVIAGNYEQLQGPVSTGNAFYTFDTTPTFSWGAGVDGTYYNGSNTATMAAAFETEAEMTSNDPPLAAFVYGLMGLLPVELILFNGTPHDGSVKLHWATAHEEGSDKFVLEKSLDGKSFHPIGEIESAGESQLRKDYFFQDENPKVGYNYYRLKQIDFDGGYTYYPYILVNYSDVKSIRVFPNPVVDDLIQFSLNFKPLEQDQVIVLDNVGAEVLRININTTNESFIAVNELKSGTYFLKYVSKDFHSMVRVIIQ